ncbi:hypothetical protein EIP86_005665 [Pleurotus ostreatoroseus]|nr:hypothetical protein EIP86_005665 [Pleurotus ostreatoroseus]
MASPATHAGSNASHSSGPSRAGWGTSLEPGAAFRGMTRGGPRGRGGRGGHRGGRPTSGRGGAAPNSDSAKKPPQDQPSKDSKDKGPSVSPKAAAASASSHPPPSSTQANGANKPSSRPKVARKASETKAPKKPSLGVDTVTSPASNTSTSNTQPSPRTPRRRRSHASSKAHQVPPALVPIPGLPSKPILTSDSNNTHLDAGKLSPAPVKKDLPPHLVPHSATAPTFDIRHDIDALVEKVRSTAMDRPHTPGSHIDWAGEDDDSLPDLDDWGVPSTHTTDLASDAGKGNVISPILQDTLRPLPNIIDIDIPTPSIQLHEVKGDEAGVAVAGDKTPQFESEEGTSVHAPTVEISAAQQAQSNGDVATPEPPKVEVSPPPHSSSPNPSSIDGVVANGVFEFSETFTAAGSAGNTVHKDVNASIPARPQPPRDMFSAESSPASERGLGASMHAVSKSLSPPHFMRSPPHNAIHGGPRGGGFQPTHARAHTVGRYRPDHLSDSDRPRRGDTQSHGRNHSTPPAGSGAMHGHSRTTSRPVITGDAISRLARTLGGTPLAKREAVAPVAPAKAT